MNCQQYKVGDVVTIAVSLRDPWGQTSLFGTVVEILITQKGSYCERPHIEIGTPEFKELSEIPISDVVRNNLCVSKHGYIVIGVQRKETRLTKWLSTLQRKRVLSKAIKSLR